MVDQLYSVSEGEMLRALREEGGKIGRQYHGQVMAGKMDVQTAIYLMWVAGQQIRPKAVARVAAAMDEGG